MLALATLASLLSFLPSLTLAAPAGTGGKALHRRDTDKAGVAWPEADAASFGSAFADGTLTWYYDWSTAAESTAIAGEFVAQVWSSASDLSVIPSGAIVLGYNEPDEGADMTMDEVISGWVSQISPLKAAGHTIGSPAFADTSLLETFLTTCAATSGCETPDFLAVHIYQSDYDAFVSAIETAYGYGGGLPVWVTEFCMYNFGDVDTNPTSVEEVNDYMGQTTLWLDETEWIGRYSWFGAGTESDLGGVSTYNMLQDSTGALTSLGEQYVYTRNDG